MMTHEYDAYCDTQNFTEPDYHEQCLVMQEFEETRDNALRQEGAREALAKLRTELAGYDRMYGTYNDEVTGVSTVGRTGAGLAVAIQAVDALLQAKGGAA